MRLGQHRGVRKTILALCSTILLAALVTVALPGTAQARRPATTYYVSLGDSYSVGFQPTMGATSGYTVYVAKHTHMTLVNFGCGGATTISILTTVGCPDVLRHTAGVVRYPTTTQIAAATTFITAHHGHIGLITVSIGGNDVTACATAANPITCVSAAASGITSNVTTLASDLRAAAGAKVPIIGSTYPDVLLGNYVYPAHPAAAATISLANLSVTAFKVLINPALSKAYATSYAALVDVTAATGAYTSLDRTVKTKKYGTIPIPVSRVCTLTWFCTRGDIHARTPGYTLIGKLIVARYHAIERK
jgi:hypothetical protein